MANPSPLDPFVTKNNPREFRLPDLPRLADHVKESGFSEGIQKFDQALMQWRQDAERTIIERIQAGQPSSNLQ